MRRVAVTGAGVLTPVGNSVPELLQALREGKCGIAPITRFDTTGFGVSLAGELKDFRPEERISRQELRKMDLFTVYALAAAGEAMERSGLRMEEEDRSRVGVIVSSGIGGIGSIQSACARGQERGWSRISPYFIPMTITNMAAGQIAIRYGIHGLCSSVVTACAGGTSAVGEAFRQIRDGYHDVMVCGGAEAAVTELGIGGFAAMKALSPATDPDRASIPFDRERSGFVMGEGAGILVLEEYERAKSRGAEILCEVTGYGVSCDAYHITAPCPDGSAAAACMKQAMAEAGITPSDVDYINAHGTSTALNDRCETLAVKQAFGDAASGLMVSSTKSMTGHLLGAAGAVEAVISALSLKHGLVPATINYRVPDPDCDLDVVPNTPRKREIQVAMSTSLGFGGHNAALVFRKA